MKKILLIIILSLSISACKDQQDTKNQNSQEITVSSTNKEELINKDEEVDFQKYFDELNIQGSITIYDYKNKKWIFSDKEDADKQTLPASTFKIPNSLIFLEEGGVKDENEILKWDGVKRSIASHNGDTNLKDAYKNSTVWFYSEITKKIGKEKYKKYMEEFKYGNENLEGKDDYFWLDETLIISPVEQINFLIGLYEEKYSISQKTYDTVKEIMINEKSDSYVLRSKTGMGGRGKIDIGWFVGYVETKDNVYFFATRLWQDKANKNKDFIDLRKIVTVNILKGMDFIK